MRVMVCMTMSMSWYPSGALAGHVERKYLFLHRLFLFTLVIFQKELTSAKLRTDIRASSRRFFRCTAGLGNAAVIEHVLNGIAVVAARGGQRLMV